jgi:NADPH:quinone reductase-like Zn-dependent oxidoreductase
MRAWEIVSDGGVDALALNDRAMPGPGPGQVLIQVHASSINYRDLTTIEDPVSRNLPYPTVPNSDAAGEVVAIGDGVDGFSVGDRIATCFFEAWPDGTITPAAMASALGGARQGVLAEHVVLNADSVVPVPAHLDWRQAATLPCAALTAWHALTEPEPIAAGDTVLLLGTGGVSVFAQQFCRAMGARTIVTSSSDAKLQRMRDLGAAETVNYRETPDWESTVLEMTDGAGVDRIVEVGGPGTLQKSLEAVRVGGHIALIGLLAGAQATVAPLSIMRKSISVRGIYVGSRRQFLDMNKAITEHHIEPVVDQTFAFDDARAAYHRMRGAEHFGKLVIDMK